MYQRSVVAVVLMLALAAFAAWAEETSVRVFELHFISVHQASKAIDPLLSENGSVTLQSKKSRLTVQDRPEVVAKVAETLAILDRKPDDYRIRVELFEGTSGPLAPELRAKVEPRVRKAFPFRNYQRIGGAEFEGEMGDRVMANLGSGYRISFVPVPFGLSDDSPYHIPDQGTRMQLQSLVLERMAEGGRDRIDVLRGSVDISPKQAAHIRVGSSEDSDHGLVLIIKALPGGER